MNVLVLGRRGLGKSTLALHKARQLNTHVIIFDPGSQFKKYGIEYTSDLSELADRIEQADDDKPFAIAYVPKGEPKVEWIGFAACIWRYGDYALIVDEAHELQSFGQIDSWLARFWRQAPRREKGDPDPIDVIQTSHTPKDFNSLSFSLADETYLFRLMRARDVVRVEEEYGVEVAEEVTRLRTPEDDPAGREFISVNVTTLEHRIEADESTWNAPRKPREEQLVYA